MIMITASHRSITGACGSRHNWTIQPISSLRSFIRFP